MRFVESVAITFTSRIIIVLIAVASSIITARWLGPAGKGTFAVLWVIVGLGVQFGNFGLQASSVYFSAKGRLQASKIASTSLWFGITVGGIISFGIVWMHILKPDLFSGIPRNLVLVTALLIPVQLVLLFFRHIFLGLQRILTYNLFELVERLCLLAVIIFLLVIFKRGLFELMVCILVITAIIFIFFAIYTRRTTEFVLFQLDKALFGKMFRYGFKAYLGSIFAFLAIRSDMLLVNYFKGAGASGIYSVAVNFAELLYLLPVTIATLVFSKVSATVTDDGTFTQKVSRYSSVLMVLVCILAVFIRKPLILLMYGEQFNSSALPLLWLLPGVFFLSLATLYNNDLAGRGYPLIIVLANGTSFALNFGLNLLFIPRWGIVGAAISSSISYFVLFMLVLRYMLRRMCLSAKEYLIVSQNEIKFFFKKKLAIR